jgi:hypothetical protein
MNLCKFNSDILYAIGEYLSCRDCVNLLRVCRDLQYKIGMSSIWKKFITLQKDVKTYGGLALLLTLNENKLYTQFKLRTYYGESYHRFIDYKYDHIYLFVNFYDVYTHYPDLITFKLLKNEEYFVLNELSESNRKIIERILFPINWIYDGKITVEINYATIKTNKMIAKTGEFTYYLFRHCDGEYKKLTTNEKYVMDITYLSPHENYQLYLFGIDSKIRIGNSTIKSGSSLRIYY